ncbi:HypC/HybG/HupF family hydrogenase formation chaperone [Clostridium sp.]|uniref:HypC/HybG/HupF family hydrogenase formation chaperone n=1 Tax=Clostridium sp. TaxID=1506 RepID=UPI002A91E0C4|nr:HypC/HybG/HupF family hydrogenase formation chaperone [Clostridium sp.]MDY6012745.1 HypC/HybG/HupF family hydrogenase formation chaperone [Clostridium sp.]
MCVAIPGQVIELYEGEALVEFIESKKKVNTSLIKDVKVGDYLLIHVGVAIEKIDKEEGEKTVEIFKSMISKLEEKYE